jgi:RND family efflux transporter MFP subunit
MKRFFLIFSTSHLLNFCVVFCFVLFIFLASGCGDKIEPGTSARTSQTLQNVPIETAEITEQPILYEAVGTVQAGASIQLSSKLMGIVEKIQVREGDEVKAGQPLVVIDPRQVEAGLLQAEAGLVEAKKELAAAVSTREAAVFAERLARSTYDRYLKLRDEDSVSAQEFDEVEARYLQAKSGAAQAQAMVDTAAAQVRRVEAALSSVAITRKDAVVAAPYNGIITGKKVEAGDLAAPGTPLLTMDTLEEFRVDMVLPEAYLENVKTGQQVRVAIPALGKETFEGAIRTIVPIADQRTRSFLVKVTLLERLSLRTGMFARVQFPLAQASKILIPQEAVIYQGQLTGLFAVDPEGFARFHLIRLGQRYQDRVEVLSGLQRGERYVARLDPRLIDGTRVESKP